MRFNPKADISGGRVSGSRGGGGGGGGLGGLGGLPIPGGLGIKGTIVVIILYFILQMCTGGGLPGSSLPGVPGNGGSDGSSGTNDDAYENCKTGKDANTSVDCARKGVVESIENFWAAELPKHGFEFQPAPVITFRENVNTACGAANSGIGPFYCPGDMTIYEDPAFYDDIFEKALGGEDHPFVEPYVLGHEYGHHISNLIKDLGKGAGQGAGSGAVNVELQADCFAGLWARAAETVPDDQGQTLIEDLTDEDIEAAIGAAKTVGDDYIQERTQGRVNENEWTHGSSAQRMAAFQLGYNGDFDSCDWDNVKSEINS